MKSHASCLALVFSLFIGVSPLRAAWESSLDVPGSVQALLFKGPNLFAGAWFPGVFLSTDNGTTWTEMNNGLWNTDVFALAVNGEYLFAGTNGGGVFRSTNDGASWTSVNTGLSDLEVISLAVHGTILFAGTWGGGVYRSTNNGANWTSASAGLPSSSVVQAFAAGGVNLYAGTGGGLPNGVFMSTNDGASWLALNSGLTNLDVRAFAEMGSSLFAGTAGGQGGVFVTTNGGANWTEVTNGLTSPAVFSFAVSGTVLFAGTSGGGVYHSSNGGGDWIEDGPSPHNVYSLAFNETHLFAGVYEGYVLRRPLSEVTTSVEMLAGASPKGFALAQNYPNPFNFTTAIRFAISTPGLATLKVYDMAGREVATLLNGMATPGTYQAVWDAAHCAAGIYVCRLQTAEFTESRQMVLLR